MRKNPLLVVACCLMLVVLACALLLPVAARERVLLIALAVLAGCVYMICESRVLRAYAPIVIHDEPARQEEDEPPESGCK